LTQTVLSGAACFAAMQLPAFGLLMLAGHTLATPVAETSLLAISAEGGCKSGMSMKDCAAVIAGQIVSESRKCFAKTSTNQDLYKSCVEEFCGRQCGTKMAECKDLCVGRASPLFTKLATKADDGKEATDTAHMSKAQLQKRQREAEREQEDAMAELRQAQQHMVKLNDRMKDEAKKDIEHGNKAKGEAEMAKAEQLDNMQHQIEGHLDNVQAFSTVAVRELHQSGMGFLQNHKPAALQNQKPAAFMQLARAHTRVKARRAPEDDLAKETTHDLEMNFNKIAPFGKEDTAKELQDHAAKTQDTLVDAVENAEVAEIKRAVFRALTRLRAATIKEFDTIARLETQAIDAYNDAHHYRAENPLAHLHEDEAPVETDKLKSFH